MGLLHLYYINLTVKTQILFIISNRLYSDILLFIFLKNLQRSLCKLQLNGIHQNIPFSSYILADIAYLLETCLFEARLST